MKWREVKDVAWFVFVFILAIYLIENVGNSFLVEMAGDLFGAFALMFLAAERALRDDDESV
jgi:hypothetical protein